jgi:3-hydroxybutyryl-CoA dehydrogenase
VEFVVFMANLLLFGSSGQIRHFSGRITPGHRIYVIASDPISLQAAPGVNVVSDFADLPDHLDAIFELSYGDAGEKQRNLRTISKIIWTDTSVFVNALTMTATEAASQLGAGASVLGFSFIPRTFAGANLLEVASSLQARPEALSRGVELLRELLGIETEAVVDRVGLVSARILAMVINEAAFALMEGVADAADIDTAMKLGTNYPEGPLRWADTIGVDVVLSILEALHDEYQEERYRPCVLLKQYARAGMAFHEKG